jgi:hypothetical protein
MEQSLEYTAKEGPVRIKHKCLVYHLYISRNETVQLIYFQNRIIMFCLPIPTLILYICEKFIYFQDRPAYFAAAKYVDRSWDYINRSQNT